MSGGAGVAGAARNVFEADLVAQVLDQPRDQVLFDHPGGRSRLRLHMRSRPGSARPGEPTGPNGSG